MPYIKQQERNVLDEKLHKIISLLSVSGGAPGELNYIVTKIALAYVEGRGARYTTFNEVIGALDCAKAEFYRRVVAPYEDQKCYENGDVYTPHLEPV